MGRFTSITNRMKQRASLFGKNGKENIKKTILKANNSEGSFKLSLFLLCVIIVPCVNKVWYVSQMRHSLLCRLKWTAFVSDCKKNDAVWIKRSVRNRKDLQQWKVKLNFCYSSKGNYMNIYFSRELISNFVKWARYNDCVHLGKGGVNLWRKTAKAF